MSPSTLSHLAEQFAPVALLAVIAWVTKAWIDARVRGKLVASNSSQDLIQAVLSNDEESRRLAPLRWGIVLTCLAAGLAVIEALGWREPTPGVFAILVGATGVGHLIFFAVVQRLRLR